MSQTWTLTKISNETHPVFNYSKHNFNRAKIWIIIVSLGKGLAQKNNLPLTQQNIFSSWRTWLLVYQQQLKHIKAENKPSFMLGQFTEIILAVNMKTILTGTSSNNKNIDLTKESMFSTGTRFARGHSKDKLFLQEKERSILCFP